ncbi:MAG: hypothetical protein ACI92I_000598 [Acidimicrobiales bacterium]|jgi:hypothetical protein
MFPFIQTAHAASKAQMAAQCFVNKINDAILFPLIMLMMALAFLFFLYGAFEYVKNANNESARETGRNHLFYGVIGMLVMLSAYTLLSIAAGTFGIGMFNSDSVGCNTPTVETGIGGGFAETGSFGQGNNPSIAPITPVSGSRSPGTPGLSQPDVPGGFDAYVPLQALIVTEFFYTCPVTRSDNCVYGGWIVGDAEAKCDELRGSYSSDPAKPGSLICTSYAPS